jgi:hypothetical protein
MFLRGAGASLALPLLQLPGRARAQEGSDFPTRLIVVYQPNGTKKELWSPAEGATETVFEMGPLLAPLARHQANMVYIDGVDMTAAGEGPGGPHQRGMATVLSGAVISHGDFVGGDGRRAGWGGGISVDQYLAQRLQPGTALSSLELGVRVKEAIPRGRIVYRGSDQPVPPENDPVAAYGRLFGTTGVLGGPNEMERRLVRRRSILDAVKGDFAALSQVVASIDRLKLEQHADALRDLERRLGVIADRPDHCMPAAPASMEVMGEAEYRDLLRAQIDVMVNAMACDLTRIGSIQCSTSVNALRFTFMDLADHEGHSLSHSGDGNENLQDQWERMLVWYSEQQAYLLDQLASVPEGEGTLLDNTVVLFVNEISRGNTHSHVDMPFMLAGKASGALRTGRYLKYNGAHHNDLLTSVVHLFGLEDPTFGDRRFCNGPLPGL